MKLTAIDTNTLLNYRLQREPHFQLVKKLFARCLDNKEQIFVPNLVFLESEWVLRSVYKQSKNQVLAFFQELFLLESLMVQDKKELELALNLYKSSSGVSFTDCVILTQIQSAQPDDFLTFDENLRKLYTQN